ncbi:alpha/beta fold hydrolase [Massilia sp.]|uniref:alpha/beta hydrolase family protein n=1 Tax=Massilia sp. TaxID=1882437 RepID=UPI0028A1794F|nr:alpha/beta fold hydrolase [Massilia sp.]
MSRFANRCISSVFLGLMLAASVPLTAHAAPAEQRETFDFKTWSIQRVTLPRAGAPAVSYYLSPPKKRSPLVLFVQGSGCTAPFSGLGTANRSASIFPYVGLAMSGRFAVMAVDKPYQLTERQDTPPNGALECSADFNKHYSYDSWLATLRQALQHALARPDVDPRRVLVVGMSEGGVLASGLARAMPEVGAVALVGSSGTTQLYDMIASTYQSSGSDADKLKELQSIEATVQQIMAEPDSVSKFAWGHTYRRWSSFLSQSPADNLLQSKARVYIASGMQDKSVPILSSEAMYAQLRMRGRDVTMVRVPGGSHDLLTEAGGREQVQQEYDAIIRWFEGR